MGLASGSSAGYARTVALNTKGSRPLVVDGVAYRWNVRRKPSYGQLLGESNLVFAVERSDVSGQVLVVDTGQLRPDAALHAARGRLQAGLGRRDEVLPRARTCCSCDWSGEEADPRVSRADC